MAVWPEERLRERLEGTKGLLELDRGELLREFGARRPTDRARADVEAALAEQGVGLAPPGWARATIRLYLLDAPAAAADLAAAPREATARHEEPRQPGETSRTREESPPPRTGPSGDARRDREHAAGRLAALYEAREAAAVAYCGRICAPPRATEAVEAAFAAVAEAGELDDEALDALLLEKVRGAAARRAPTLGGHHGRRGDDALCREMPMLLAARASGYLTKPELEALDRQLEHCATCRGREERFAEAEAAYAAMCDSRSLAAVRARLLGQAHGLPAPDGGSARGSGSLWRAEWAQEHDGAAPPRVVMRRAPGVRGRPPAEPPAAAPAAARDEMTVGEHALEIARDPRIRRGATVAALVAGSFAVASLAAALLRSGDETGRPRPVDPRPAAATRPATPSQRASARAAAALNAAARTGDPVGRLSVPRLGVHRIVAQGAAAPVLQTMPGHDPRTALPGGVGTVAFLGHRRAYAAPLRWVDRLRGGDRLVMTLPYGRFTYVVRGIGVVRPGVSIDLGRSETGKLLLGAGDPPVRAAERILVTARMLHTGRP